MAGGYPTQQLYQVITHPTGSMENPLDAAIGVFMSKIRGSLKL